MADTTYRVYGLDRKLYGPVPLPTLEEWARDGRVQRDTWIHLEIGERDAWQRAEDVEALASIFEPAPAGGPQPNHVSPDTSKTGVSPKVLTRLKVFADFPAEELEPFARAMVEESYRPFSYVVQQGTQSNAMYFVIQGRVGVSTKGQVAESFLAALNVGETFGEMSLFDSAPRSANVRADTDVIVLKLTAESLAGICREAPAAANRFLWNAAKLLSARMRQMDKRAASAKDMDVVGRAVN